MKKIINWELTERIILNSYTLISKLVVFDLCLNVTNMYNYFTEIFQRIEIIGKHLQSGY